MLFGGTGPHTVSLPDAAIDVNEGWWCTIKNTAAYVVTVDSQGGDVEGDTEVYLGQGDAINAISDGTDWWLF